jgi:two-component system response regulator RegX3
MQKILVIDNGPETCSHISQSLSEHFQLETENNMDDVLEKDLSQYSGFLIDTTIGQEYGANIVSMIRKKLRRPAPLCLISDNFSEEDLNHYYQHQADELLLRSADPKETQGRFLAALQRVKNFYRHLEYGPIRINLSRAKVIVRGEVIECTSTEYRILCTLINELNNKDYVPRANFIQFVWDGVSVEERTISTHLSNLNKKLKLNGIRIKTKRSQGLFVEIFEN